MKLFLLLLPLLMVAEPLAVEPKARVYVGASGLEVVLVRLSPPSRKEALLQFNGLTDPEWNGLVLLHELSGKEWTTRVDGVPVVTLSGVGKKLTARPPDGSRDQGVPVALDEARSKRVVPAAVLADYEKLAATPRLARLREYDRKRRIARTLSETWRPEVDDFRKACGQRIKVDIDWNSWSDDVLATTSAAGYCDPALDALQAACAKPDGAKRVGEKVRAVLCSYGTAPKLELSGGVLRWTVVGDATNLEELAARQLEGML